MNVTLPAIQYPAPAPVGVAQPEIVIPAAPPFTTVVVTKLVLTNPVKVTP